MDLQKGKAQEMFRTSVAMSPDGKSGIVRVLASLPQVSMRITIMTDVREKETGKLLAKEMWMAMEVCNFMEDIYLTAEQMGKELEITSRYKWIDNSLLCCNGEVNIREQTCIRTYTPAAVQIVKGITVDAPVSKNGKGKVQLYYNRSSNNGDYCYVYQFDQNSNNPRTEVFLPFRGTLECNYQIVDMQLNEAWLQYYTNGGKVNFDGKDKIVWTKSGKFCSWAFPDDWENVFDVTKISMYNTLYLHAAFNVAVRIDGILEKFDIEINSEDNPSGTSTSCLKQIYPLTLCWGCLAPETLIRMADGQQKRIDTIRVGEKVLSASGKAVCITDVITGTEQIIVVIITERNKQIRLTSNHPVETERGVLPVNMLNASDRVRVDDGEYEQIYQLYTEEYNDRIYNLKLEEESLMFGNGISVGDFDYQQQNYASVATPVFSEEEKILAEILDEEFKRIKNGSE